MTPEQLNLLVLSACGVLLVGVAAVRLSTRSGMPGLLLFLAIGLVLGESGLGIPFDDGQLAFNVATIMVAVLLANGGFTTRWSDLQPVALRSGIMASVGVLLSVGITASLAVLFLDVDVRTAILLSAMVSSTDAAAVFSVLRRLPIKARVRTLVEGESGFNDPPAIIIVTVVISDAWNQGSVLVMFGTGLYQLVGGAIVGLVIARIGQGILQRVSLPSSGLYPLATLSIAMVAFGLGGIVGASGLLAAYAAGLWLGNQALPHHRTTEGFIDSLAWLAEIGLFVMLGLLASPALLPAAIVPALVIGSALTFVARPLSVILCMTPFRMPWREQAFTSWSGLRGAVPIMLATIPLTQDLPRADEMFHVIFLLVVIFTLIQGPTLPWAAKLAGVTEPLIPTDVSFDSSPIEGLDACMLQLEIPENTQLTGIRVAGLPLPRGVVVSMLIRKKTILVPDAEVRLEAGDHMVMAVPNPLLGETQDRLEQLAKHGVLAD